jgi:hypothetical protein
MKQDTFFDTFIKRNIFIIFFLLIILFVSIPRYYHWLDRGNQTMDIDKYIVGQQDFHSHNVTFQGRPLVDKAIIETETHQNVQKYRRYIIPVISTTQTDKDPVYCFIVREFREWDKEGNEDQIVESFLNKNTDSIYTFSGIAMNFLYEKYFEGLSEESLSFFKKKQGLVVADNPLLVKIDYRVSKLGLTFMISFQLVLLTWILISFFMLKKHFKKKDVTRQ